MTAVRCILAIIVFALPLFAGFLFKRKHLLESYLYGQILLWAVFQIIAVPMIHLRLTFNVLWISYTTVTAGFCVWGGTIKFKSRQRRVRPEKEKKDILHYLPYFFAVGIIAYQMAVYIFGMHLDEDDARWIAEANDALVKNRMYLHNPATGEYIGRFVGEMQKDVFSPWGMYIAVLSRNTLIPAVVIAHTVYPPILLGLCYVVYDLMGRELFKGTTERGLFLLMVTLINLFMGGNVYTQSVFTLTRIWQGKAVVAAVMIPLFLLLLLRTQREDTVINWLWFGISGCACCLFSGMGIIISVILIAVYGLYAVVCKRFRRLPWLLLSLLPSIAYGFFYFQMKG